MWCIFTPLFLSYPFFVLHVLELVTFNKEARLSRIPDPLYEDSECLTARVATLWSAVVRHVFLGRGGGGYPGIPEDCLGEVFCQGFFHKQTHMKYKRTENVNKFVV